MAIVPGGAVTQGRSARSLTERGGGDQSAGVTTVLITADNNGDATVITRQATSIGWFPEWVVPGEPGTRGIDRNTAVRSTDQVQWANALALTFDIRRGATGEQHWYRAFREGCPDCPELGPVLALTAIRELWEEAGHLGLA